MASSVPSPHSHTVSAVAEQLSLEEEDDNDICPVCDGECTCSNNVSRNLPSPQPVAVATGPLSMEELSRQYKVVTSSSTPTSQQRTPQLHQHSVPKPPPPKPSLKIKFTVPQSLLAKRRATPSAETTPRPHHYSNHDGTMFAGESDDEPLAGPSSLVRSPPLYDYPFKPAPKKRGRPRKVLPSAARDLSVDSIPTRPSTSPSHRRTNPKTSIIGRPKQPSYATKLVKSIKNRPPPTKKRSKKPGPKRRRPAYLDSDASSESSLSDDEDMFGLSHSYETGGVDTGRFPTFVSASALSSMDSDNDSSDSSMSDFSDSSMQNEEEGFILSEIQQRARVNRELLGDNAKKTSQNNEWVIRPRKKSVGLSDAEVDTDATEDEDEDEALAMAEADEDEDDETDGRSVGGSGLVTGWSEEDEESSFDADLFFSNLSTTSDSDSSSDESMREVGLDDGDDDTVSDASTEGGLHHMREGLENLPLEITEGWDGQLVFTNGLPSANTGLIDLDFERDASTFIVPPEAQGCPGTPGQEQESDVEMTSYGSDGDDGYATDGGEGEGDTTDEELVDDNDLPNERAMKLFNFPHSVNAINPLSTVSPMVTPAKNRFTSGPYGPPPTPADILSGSVFYDSDDMDELFDDESRRRTLSMSSKGSKGGPRKGIFMVVQQARRQAVIDDKHAEIPSPHPRFNRDRRARKISAIEALIKKHFNAMKNELALAASAAPVASDDIALLPSVEITATAGPSSTTEPPGTQTPSIPIELDDVLDASFLHPDPADSSQGQGDSAAEAPPESGTADDDSDSNTKEVRHLQRWDVISVSAFRQTREHAAIMDSPSAPSWTPGSRRTPASSSDYGLRASPFSTMLWPTNKRSKREGKGVARAMSVSPLLQPTRADGDATPTGRQMLVPHQPQQQHSDHQDRYSHKSKKEMKKEKKLKRKGFNGHGHHANHHHHSHHHYPNSKTRGTGSVQRSGYVSGVPPLNL